MLSPDAPERGSSATRWADGKDVQQLVGLALAAIALAFAFLCLLFLLHLLKPDFDPAWRWISEYEIGSFGWMMRLAFFSWGASVLVLAIALWPSLQTASGIVARWWFVVISVALFGAGLFKTNAITDRTPNVANTLHAICGILVILTFPIAATLAAVSLSHDVAWSAARIVVTLATVLTWAGLVTFMGSNVLAGRRAAVRGGVGGSDVRVGWQNRFMVVTYAVWVMLLSGALLRL